MLAIEQERAKEREKELGKEKGGDTPSDNVTQRGDEGRARDKAAEKINASVSGQTLEKGKEVKDKAESEDEPEVSLTKRCIR